MMSNLPIRVIRKYVLRTSANMVGQIAGRNYDHKREVVSRKKMIKLLKTKHLIPNENYT